MENKDRWRLADYLITAKESIDSLMYIHKNENSIYKSYDVIHNEKGIYYISLCNILDHTICKKNKKDLTQKDYIIKDIYNERDKHYAHDDKNYNLINEPLDKEIHKLIKYLKHIKHLCNNYLPNNITLDYVCHDQALFRQINGITKEKESSIYKTKYKNDDIDISTTKITKTIINDTNRLKKLSENDKKDIAILIHAGLTFEETIQNTQRGFINANIQFGTDMWGSINKQELKEIINMRNLGYFDKFGIPNESKFIEDIEKKTKEFVCCCVEKKRYCPYDKENINSKCISRMW